ncbi:hypothetical protein J5Y04_34375 [Kitasatospora sp. RG8]|uniref:hypothetical protein n=1 Tax=Kitasatospora sp. RG8 TaxID=2820815 RepID=UPI001ADF63C5|nr:hypothetical protein [Kitasatospora sp. RG8]MBP0454573.1 hypothetical protein [Kitasatospora sp. RG8]
MTGDKERERPAGPLSEMREGAPDDLFAGRSTRAADRPEPGAAYGGDDDLYGSLAAVAPDEDDGENSG